MDKKSEYQDQIKEISEQIVKEPDNVSFYIKRANLYEVTLIDFLFTNKKSEEEYYKKKYEEDNKKILDITPNTTQGILRKSYFCQIHNNYEKAIEGYTKLISNKKLPKNPILFYQRGICYFELHKYKEVINDLTNAMNLYRNEKLIKKDIMYLSRGFSYYFLEKYSNARSDFLKLLEENSDIFKEIRYEFAVSCYFTGKYKEALSQINTIIESDPQNYRAIFYRSLTYKKLKNINQAIKDEKIINQALKNKNEVYEDIGLIYYQHNEWDKALDCFRKVEYELSKEAIEIIEKISTYYLCQGKYGKAINACENYLDNLDVSWWKIGCLFRDHLQFINDKQKEFEIFQTKIDERNKTIADLSHSIKNMISSVIDPLENLKKGKEVKPIIIDNALRGSNLIREIVNAMSLSFKGSFDDFIYDAKHNSEKESLNLNSMFIESLKYSVMNMFDGKHFSNFTHKYFPLKDSFLKAKEDWEKITQSQDKQKIEKFLKNHFFDINFNFDKSVKYVIGSEKGSAIKLMILLQEIIFNAVKYSSFVKKDERFLKINFFASEEEITIKVENRYKPKVKIKTTGLGHVIIENFAKLLNTKPVIKKSNDIYSISMTFKNFWGK